MACWVLPNLAFAAAVRACEVVVTRVAIGYCAATNKRTPHTLLSLCQRSRLAAAVADDAGGLLPPPVSALTTRDYGIAPRVPVRRVCLLLPSCVNHLLPGGCRCLLFRRVAFCAGLKIGGSRPNS